MVDTASVFLAISCWHRPADIYDEIFVLTRGCAEKTATGVEGGKARHAAVGAHWFVRARYDDVDSAADGSCAAARNSTRQGHVRCSYKYGYDGNYYGFCGCYGKPLWSSMAWVEQIVKMFDVVLAICISRLALLGIR